MSETRIYHSSNKPLTPLKRAAYSVAIRLTQAGFTALYAGGWVRDLLMGKEGDDIDIATDATPNDILSLFPKSIPVGISFGVVRVLYDSFQFEVATFRTDGMYDNGRHPTSIQLICNPLEDAKRRDFTVNGLFYNPITQEIIDYVNGITDIKKNIIRTIGSPFERFSEDKLRVIRAIRFKNALGFIIDPLTWEAICHFAPHTVQFLSPERIWQEFEKMKKKKVVISSLQDLFKAGLFPYLFPSLTILGPEESSHRIENLTSIDEEAFQTVLIIGSLFSSTEKENREALVKQYKLSNSEMKALNTLTVIETALLSGTQLSELEWVRIYAYPFAVEVLRLIGERNQGILKEEVNFHLHQRKQLSFWVDQLVTKQLFIGGKDLSMYGFKEGKKMGDLIEKAFIHSLEVKCKNKKQIIQSILE